jgi:hypothetical protein
MNVFLKRASLNAKREAMESETIQNNGVSRKYLKTSRKNINLTF